MANQEAANLVSEALHDGKRALPPYAPFLPPELNEAPWVIQDPDYKRACGNGKARQQKNGAGALFMNTGQLSLAYLRYIIASEVAGAWGASGGMGSMLSHLAHLRKLTATQNMGSAFGSSALKVRNGLSWRGIGATHRSSLMTRAP